VRVVKRGAQANLPRQQHAVAEHVAAHVADADRVEGGRLDVFADLAKMTVHASTRRAQ